jgi:hypothetical protein
MEANISSIEGSRCTLLAVAIVTSAALVTTPDIPPRSKRPDSNHPGERNRLTAIRESPIWTHAGFQQIRAAAPSCVCLREKDEFDPWEETRIRLCRMRCGNSQLGFSADDMMRGRHFDIFCVPAENA